MASVRMAGKVGATLLGSVRALRGYRASRPVTFLHQKFDSLSSSSSVAVFSPSMGNPDMNLSAAAGNSGGQIPITRFHRDAELALTLSLWVCQGFCRGSGNFRL
ncbi:unnamed protein product [Menidia menidia]|uniref:(Atlantic silverside) hypothetical protein n=1 Tax=Menidia menidia TaxID=238744 RepID=A0A8S4BB28_9TELE|nr:unnamed protein product [Menidia menidia]